MSGSAAAPDTMPKTAANRPTLLRTLGVFDGVAILVGITIGAGIYSTPQIIAGYQSSFLPIVAFWLLAGCFVYIGGLIYAELGTRLPNTGGEYVYLHRAFGPYAGFLFGWAQLFIIRTSPAAGLSIIAVNYIGHFVELGETARVAAAMAIIMALGALNYAGIRWGSRYQNFSTIFKVAGLLFLVIFGLLFFRGVPNLLQTTAPPTSTLGPLGSIGALMMMIVFSYLGWDRVGYVAGEMKDPKRIVPRTMFWGIGVVVLVYILANFLYHATLGMEGVRASERVASDTATLLLGPVGAALVALTVIVSTTGSTNGTIMTASRVYFAMARDGLFFRWLDYIHPRFRTPSRAIIAHCVWAIVILLVRQNFENIVAGMTFAILIFYAMTTLALFKLRRQQVGGSDIYRVPLYPLLPLIYLAGILSLIAIRGFYEWERSLVDLAFIATGIPFALYWCRRPRPARDESAGEE